MTVTFLIDNIKMRRTGISYPFVLEVPEFGQIAGRVTETQRGATQVAFPPLASKRSAQRRDLFCMSFKSKCRNSMVKQINTVFQNTLPAMAVRGV